MASLPVLRLFPSYPKTSFALSYSSSPSMSMSSSQFAPKNQSVAVIVFGDGSESRLYPLTKRRSEGALPIAANYRVVDAVVSNCINSDINRIYAFTQFNSTSLNSHLSKAYTRLGLGKEGFLEVIAAHQSLEDQAWFRGSADAMRRCMSILEEFQVSEFLVLPGHHLYRMDYQKLIQAHRVGQADITMVVLNSTRDHDPGFGMLQVNAEGQVVGFNMNFPVSVSAKADNDSYRMCPSMGIYLVKRDTMEKLLLDCFPSADDFAKEVIPGAINDTGMKVQAYAFDGYWEDLSSIAAFYRANMECTKTWNLGYNIYDGDFPLHTMPRNLPPSSISEAVITDSVVGDGCILNRCKIKGSVVGMRSRIGERVVIEDSIIMGSDTYQEEDGSGRGKVDRIPVGIGDDSQIRKAIIDKNARIGRSVMVINKDGVEEGSREGEGYVITGGIVVVLQNAVIPNGFII